MTGRSMLLAAALLLALAALPGCDLGAEDAGPRMTLFIGIDTSGSFRTSGSHDDAMSFLAYYIYGHLNKLGGLQPPKQMFVAGIGGNSPDEPKSFHPIHDFVGKDVAEIEASLREWYAPNDTLTDFNAFFGQIERIVKERNLVLAPVSVMIVTDGIPDLSVRGGGAGSRAAYEEIDLGKLEYLSRRMTLRLAYTTPVAGEHWRRFVPRRRVRLWTVDDEVMRGWHDQIQPDVTTTAQDRLWDWIHDNIDFRVRS